MSVNVTGVVLFITAGATVILTPITMAIARRMDRMKTPEVPEHVNARLERMEMAIDAMAEQVERVAEGQRFTTKLLSERSAPRAPELPGGTG